MSKSTRRIPEGLHGVIPHLIIKNASAAIEFYKKALGAEELLRMPGPDGKSVGHSHLRIGGGHLFLCDEFPGGNCRAPTSIGGTSVSLHIYVEDVDAAFDRAVKAGGKPVMPPTDMFWGDRFGKLADPYGHEWSLASHVEDVSPDEMARRGKEAMAAMAKQQH